MSCAERSEERRCGVSCPDDFGLGNAIDAISRCLYGVQNVPTTPDGELAFAHRQMIAVQHPYLVAALIEVQVQYYRGGLKR